VLFNEDYSASILAWQQAREQRLMDPHGWLATAGLFWLEPGENRMGSAITNSIRLLPGSGPDFAAIFTRQTGLHGDEVILTAAPDVQICVAGVPVSNRALEIVEGSSELITLNDLHIYVIERGSRLGVRIFDPANPALKTFKGLQWFPVDAGFCVSARFVPYDEPRTIPILDILGDTNEMPSPGLVSLDLCGRSFAMEPIQREDGGFWFIFRDLTAGRLTYSAGRYLNTEPPSDGFVTIDFNKAYSPPCAFTPFATCPLPPLANRLPVEILAGEKS
jgi:uncharacterized protein